MSEIDTGGPAFPVHGLPGMALRDYFAAKAMQAFISATRTQLIASDIALITKSSYIMADAMLKERKEQMK